MTDAKPLSRPQRSIQSVLLSGTIVLLLVVLGGAAWLGFDSSHHEAEEMFDARLATSARVLEALVARQLETATVAAPIVIELPRPLEELKDDEPTPFGHYYETKIAFQVWNEGGQLLMRTASAPTQPFAPMVAGFTEQRFGERSWRVFVLSSHRIWIQAAERDDIRDEMAVKLALVAVMPLMIGIPLLLLFVSLLMRYGLAPLSELAHRIEGREPGALEPVMLARAPAEIAPVMNALNGLLARVQGALARERRFTADAAHELRTPLAALKLHAENAARASSEGERQASLQRMLAAMRKTVRMAEQMLAYSRASAPVDGPAIQPVSLREVVEDATEGVQPRLHARSTRLVVTCTPEEGDFRVRGNYDQLSSLTSNLLENAIRYGPPHATIRVELSAGKSDVTLAVVDEGPGIDQEHRERVFESYFRIPGSGEGGTGLGLAIVKEIALRHEATIDIGEGAEGRGTRVAVKFPSIRGNGVPPVRARASRTAVDS